MQFDDISDRAVKVLWQPPKKINGILTGYQIQYQIKDMPNTLRLRNLSADTLSEKVNELQATTHYRFEVTAWTAVGPGPPKVCTFSSIQAGFLCIKRLNIPETSDWRKKCEQTCILIQNQGFSMQVFSDRHYPVWSGACSAPSAFQAGPIKHRSIFGGASIHSRL